MNPFAKKTAGLGAVLSGSKGPRNLTPLQRCAQSGDAEAARRSERGRDGPLRGLFMGLLELAVVKTVKRDPILVGEFTTKILGPILVGSGMFTGGTGF